MAGQLTTLRERFDERPVAEKFVVGALLLGGLIWLYLTFLAEPLATENTRLQQEINSAESRLTAMRNRETQAEARSQEDPNRAAREQIAQLITQENQARREIEELVGSVIAPSAMNGLLTNVLDVHPQLQLIRVENQSPQQLTGQSRQQTAESGATAEAGTVSASSGAGRGAQRVFSHGLLLEFQGDFLSALEYLVFLESLSESFFWDSLEFVPTEWPSAHVILQIHTLSLDEGFIGV